MDVTVVQLLRLFVVCCQAGVLFAELTATTPSQFHTHVGPQNHSLVDIVNKRTILALGDSLTAGSVYPTKRKSFPHPYEWHLQDLLRNSTSIVQAGIPGERTDQILKRLPALLQANPTIKVVVILGGTNDLYGRRWAVPANIITSLQNMYRLIWNTSPSDPIFIVAVTVPQAPALMSGVLGDARSLVNRNIREIQKRCSARMALLDLENSFDQTDKENISKYWSPDLIHFNSRGYDEMGEMLYRVSILFTSIGPHSFTLILTYTLTYLLTYLPTYLHISSSPSFCLSDYAFVFYHQCAEFFFGLRWKWYDKMKAITGMCFLTMANNFSLHVMSAHYLYYIGSI